MFSVIIPLYNKSAYILKAVNSVLTQTFPEFELIIVNDGSTDNGPIKIASIKDPRLKIINQANSGVATARNNGVKVAKYDYIAFLDADDWWDERFLAEMRQLIEKYSDAGIYGCNYFYVKNGSNHVENKGLESGFKAGYIDYFKTYTKTFCVPFNCSFAVVSKNVFNEAGGFNPRLRFGEDIDLWIRIALKRKIAYLNKPLAYSNQDIALGARALGFNKIYPKENHCIFNFSYLSGDEKKDPILKSLLDGLRVRSLIQYHVNGKYNEEVADILSGVDFSRQPFYFRFVYFWPKLIVRLFFFGKKYGSMMKQFLIKYF